MADCKVGDTRWPHVVTVRPEFAASLATDPLTQAAMAQFDADTAHSQSFA